MIGGIQRPKPQRLRVDTPAVLAFGSNMGDREETITRAITDVDSAPGVRVVAVSPLVETAALKLSGVDESAPRYLNAVALVHTVLEPHALLATVNRIEGEHGRVRQERWGDRTLDIDLIDVGGLEISDETLTLPHPRAHQRAFVLVPWLAVNPNAEIVGHGSISRLLAHIVDDTTPYPAGGSTK